MQARRKVMRKTHQELKLSLCCVRCGESHPACLDFHHRDPTQKDIVLSRIASTGWGHVRIQKEVAKCDILCANCHRKLHYEADIAKR